MDAALLAYLPMDRRHALAGGTTLPERMEGTALFADISGFTPLTEALTQALGSRRGAEELPRHLNRVYDALVGQVHGYGGSVIGFAGDAITCWFDQDTGLRATACALAMQEAMHAFAELPLPSGEAMALAIKVAVASGPVRRLLVGDPHIQQVEVLAGPSLGRLAEVEHLAHKGEVVLEASTARQLGEGVQIREWREEVSGGVGVAVVHGLIQPVSPTPWPALRPDALMEAQLRPWLLPEVYTRLREGQGEFLTELRPAVALFLRFTGLDFDTDEGAGSRLDAYLRWVQAVLARYEGTVLQLTMGDKGSYLYAAFGAPIAHEDDAPRAARAALELREPPAEFGIASLQIGISRGTMRTGAYGGSDARTYGSLGDEVNLAARLMQQAAPGQVLASGRIQAATEGLFRWQELPAVQVKGKAEPIPLFALLGERPRATIHLQEPTYTLPMVGREVELAQIDALMERAMQGQGQLVGITGEAGMGKSRLVAEVVRRATARGFLGYGGECQSYGTNIPYLVWHSIWRALFNLDPADSPATQEQRLSRALESIDATLLPRLPLLGPVLGLPLADTELTRTFDARLSKLSREALLVDILRARVAQAQRRGSALLLVLEDVHWLDSLSHDLLEAIGHASATMPLLVVLAYRPPHLTRLQAPRVTRLPHFSEVLLQELPPSEMRKLIQGKVGQLTTQAERPLPEPVLEQLLARAEGLPFYAEELLNYLHDRGLDPWGEEALDGLELPTSLHSLVLSRMDQLTDAQKIVIKVASVIGRVFSLRWLLGYYPELGPSAQVRANLEELQRLDLTPLEQPEPELTYLFKHIVTQEVAYESLTYERRATLHERFAAYVEGAEVEAETRHLELLAYHYGLSENLAKKCAYLRRAGEAAQAAYANEAAIDYYERLLPLLAEHERAAVLLQMGNVLKIIGRYEEAERGYQEVLKLTQGDADPLSRVRCQFGLGALCEHQGEYTQALNWLEQAEASSQHLGLASEESHILRLKGAVLARMGQGELALEMIGKALQMAEAQVDSAATLKALLTITNTLSTQGRYAEAESYCARALVMARDLDDKHEISRSLTALGNLAYYRSDFSTMARYQEEALVIEQLMGDRRGVAISLYNLALAHASQQKTREAQERYEQCLHLFRELGDRYGIDACLDVLGSTAHELGEDERASTLLEEVLARVREGGDMREVTNVLVNLTEVRLSQGKLAEARLLVEEALAVAEEMGDKRTIMRAHLQRGRLAWLENSLAQSRAHYLASLRLAEELGERLHFCEGLAALAGLALAEQGSPGSSVRQAAVVQSALAELNAGLSRQNREILEETLQQARSQLSEAVFAAAWAEGEALTLEEAVAEVLAASDAT